MGYFNHTGWFETRRQMVSHVIFAEKSIINLLWITEASTLQVIAFNFMILGAPEVLDGVESISIIKDMIQTLPLQDF